MTKRSYKLIRNIKETFWNKVFASLLLTIGLLTTYVSRDATALVFLAIVSIWLFFSKENHIT